MRNLQNQVVLITGAGKGSGSMLAKALAERGAIVAANDISPVNVEAVVEEINQQGRRAKTYIEDVAKKIGVQNLINQVEDDFGRIDVLIHHAAVQPNVPLLDMDEWDWHRVLDVNLTGAFLVTQSAARVMQVKGGGAIIFLVTEAVRDESSARTEPSRSEAAFVTSMSGLEAFARQAARELSPKGIRVLAVPNVRATIVGDTLRLLEAE